MSVIERSISANPAPAKTKPEVWYAPKCICILSQWAFLGALRQYLTQLYRLSLTPSHVWPSPPPAPSPFIITIAIVLTITVSTIAISAITVAISIPIPIFLTITISNTITITEQVPIERFLSNFMREVPVPPRGRIRVQFTISDCTISLTRPPLNDPLADASSGTAIPSPPSLSPSPSPSLNHHHHPHHQS